MARLLILLAATLAVASAAPAAEQDFRKVAEARNRLVESYAQALNVFSQLNRELGDTSPANTAFRSANELNAAETQALRAMLDYTTRGFTLNGLLAFAETNDKGEFRGVDTRSLVSVDNIGSALKLAGKFDQVREDAANLITVAKDIKNNLVKLQEQMKSAYPVMATIGELLKQIDSAKNIVMEGKKKLNL